MRGFPKTIGSKQDIDNLLAMPKYKAQAEAKLKEIAAARFIWQKDKDLAKPEDGKESATEKVVTTQDETGKEVHVQMKLVEDANAQIFRLGYKAADIAAVEK